MKTILVIVLLSLSAQAFSQNVGGLELAPPTGPQLSKEVTVTGIIKDTPFTFSADNVSEFFVNCLSEIRRIPYGNSDELFFSANNNRFVATKSSSWYSDTQICSILEKEARKTERGNTSQIRITGTLDTAGFRVEAHDRANLLNECISSFGATRLSRYDQIFFRLNDAQPQVMNNMNGWWTTPARACKAMIIKIDTQLR